jgi:hypothetical protein
MKVEIFTNAWILSQRQKVETQKRSQNIGGYSIDAVMTATTPLFLSFLTFADSPSLRHSHLLFPHHLSSSKLSNHASSYGGVKF